MNIGWIGLGVMGRSMCGHLLRAGHAVRVYTRTMEKAADLLAQGAVACATPAQTAAGSAVVFSMVGFPADVEQVLLGEDGVVGSAAEGTVVVDMTTSEPALARRIHQAARHRGLQALDAPVSGGDLGAREATLAIMVGGEAAVFERVRPLLEVLGRNVRLMGGPGAGQHTKMCNQIAIAGNMVGTVEALLYARRAGLGHEAVLDAIGAGAAGSWSLNNLGRRIAAGDYAPGFYIKHFVKDMGIALAEARAMNLSLPGLALVQQLYVAAMAQGLEDLGTQGLYKALERLNGGGGS